METCIDVDIVNLIVVLEESGPKKTFGKCKVNPWPDQEQISIILWLRKPDVIVTEIHGNIGNIAHPPTHRPLYGFDIPREIFPKITPQ